MKRFLLFMFICICTYCQGQTLKVVKMDMSSSDISARTLPRYDINGLPGALIKVQLPQKGATFKTPLGILGDVKNDNGEYFVYVPEKTKQLTVKVSNALPITILFDDYGIKTVKGTTNYVLQIIIEDGVSRFKKKSVYIEPQIQLGGMTAFGLSLGGYVNHLNVEASYLMGLTESEEVFWNNTNGAESGNLSSYTYKPSFIGGKVGYAFYLGRPFRITPQVGVGVVSLNGTEKQKNDKVLDAKNGYVLYASASVKIDYLILPWLGVGITPEYSIALSQSDLYERVADVSSKVDGFAKGFNVRLGVYVTF